jgi:hypothetical protein
VKWFWSVLLGWYIAEAIHNTIQAFVPGYQWEYALTVFYGLLILFGYHMIVRTVTEEHDRKEGR